MNKHILLFFSVSILFYACSREDSSTPAISMGYEYFPVNTGHAIIYDFDSIFVDTKVSVYDTTRYQLKEYIESTFPDNVNRPTQRIERYRKSKDSLTWSIINVCYSTLTKSTAERVQENQRYVKLVFPVKLNKTWDGNGFTTLPKWEYEYTGADEPVTLNGTKFDSTLTVTHIDELNLIEKEYSVEMYAKHVGLIYKEFVHLEKTPAGVVTKATKYTYKFKSYIP